MNRRTVLKGGFVLAATSHTVIAEATPSAAETQEQKCVRLLHELMVELRQLPLPIRTLAGRATDLPCGEVEGEFARYNMCRDGDMLTAFLKKGDDA